jgi:Flp pilus assembly protein CpaB
MTMADRTTATLAPPAPGNGTRPAPPTRTVGRRRTLPGSRAVVGGLLVTASAVGLFAAWSSSSSGPSDAYVVVTHDIAPGQRFQPGDLELVRIDLPSGQRSHSFTDRGKLVREAVSVNRIKAGELVQSGDVARVSAGRTKASISVPVEPGNAMGGDADALTGQRVDVIVTYTDAGVPKTATVAKGVQVTAVLTGDRDLGTSGQLTVILSVDPDQLEDIAGAAAAGKITLAVTTGVRR